MSGNGSQLKSRVTPAGPGPSMPEVEGYEIRGRIGKGGMGEVFLAYQLALGRLVAMKVLMPQGNPDPENDIARFRREAKLMAKVSHPNILSIFNFGEVDGRPYLVMEYVEGGDLRRLMKPGHPFSTEQVRSIVLPVGEALGYLHRHQIIHRDLKPENILLHDGQNPRVSDFGIAVLRTGAGSLTGTRGGLGTLGYVAPEQQYGLKVDERADQYSLAAVAYELLTGQLPLGIFKPPSDLNPRLDPEVDAVILRALQENPNHRFATIREFNAALGKALGGSPARPRLSPLRRCVWAGFALLAMVGAIVSIRALLAPVPPPLQLAEVGPANPSPSQPVDARMERLKKIRANEIWVEQGKPVGAEGERVSSSNWLKATEDVEKEVGKRAYLIWEEKGRPEGAKGEAIREENRQEAIDRLLKEWAAKEPPAPAEEHRTDL